MCKICKSHLPGHVGTQLLVFLLTIGPLPLLHIHVVSIVWVPLVLELQKLELLSDATQSDTLPLVQVHTEIEKHKYLF